MLGLPTSQYLRTVSYP